MNKIISLFILLNLTYANSQEKIGEFTNELKTSKRPIQQCFSVFNNYNNNVSTFLLENKIIYAYLLGEKLNIKTKLILKDLKQKYNVLIGKLYDNEDNYMLVLSNNKRTKFATVKFSFNTNQVLFTEDQFSMKNLRFLQSVNKGNTTHLLLLDEKTSSIISRKYTTDNKITSTIFNFENEKFLINDKKKVPLKKLLTDYTKPNHREIKNIIYELTKINENPYENEIVNKTFSTTTSRNQVNPTSIELTSRLNKLYINKNNIIITLDKNRFYTQILTLNLENGFHSFDSMKKPLFNINNMYKRSNSFIHNNVIFLVASSKNILTLSIYDFKSKKLLKEITTKENEVIKFKNSPIIQEGGAFKKYRDLEKTTKFLRKISESNIGIGAVKNEEGYEIIIGSVKQSVKGSTTILTILSMGLGGMSPSLFGIDNFSRTNFNSFTSYLTTKSVRIHSLLDNNFNHKTGEIKDNLYDKIADFIKPQKANENGGIYEIDSKKETTQAFDVFKINNATILGLYLPITKKYSFYKFN